MCFQVQLTKNKNQLKKYTNENIHKLNHYKVDCGNEIFQIQLGKKEKLKLDIEKFPVKIM